jgi:alpha-1,3-mannosyltransferase
MALRIIHVVRQYAPSVGGLEAVVARLAREQQQRLGHSVRVVTLDRLFSMPDTHLVRHEMIDGIAVTRLSWAGSSRYPLCPQVIAHLGDADLVHVHAIDFFFDWLAITRLLHRKPMVASTHGGFFHTAFASTLKRLWFQTITRVSTLGYRRVIATSDNDGAVFRRIAGDRVAVIENGAEIERYRDAASREHVPVLIYFGRWSTNKGLIELIDLMATLRTHDARWRLIIAGRPYDLSRADLAARIAHHALDDAIELHESPSDDELRALMTRASYFACLSRHEGFGIAAVEAMSAGLIPMLSDIPPFRKIIEDSRCGLLLALGQDSKVSAEKVVHLHEQTNDMNAIERERVITFTRRYDWSLVVDRYDALYRDALASKRVPRGDVPVMSTSAVNELNKRQP